MATPPARRSTATPLERRYRRLLFCYPRAYRRDELLDHLLDAAPPGRTRPTVREAADLIRHGLRARLGRPASRTVVAWAILATVIGGVYAAAFATWVGWQSAEPLPRAAQTRAMLAEILPGHEFRGVADAPAQFVIYGSPVGWANARDLLLGDGGEYDQAGVGGVVDDLPARPQDAVDQVRQRLRDTGWTVYQPNVREVDYYCAGAPCGPASSQPYITLVARRGNTTLAVEASVAFGTGGHTALTATFQRTTPSAVYPCGAAGGIAGAVAAFLLFGWASRRTQGRPLTQGFAAVLFGVTMVLWWAPPLLAFPQVLRHHLDEPHPSWHPMWEWLGQPDLSLLFLAGGGCALLALALAALPHRRTEAQPTTAPS